MSSKIWNPTMDLDSEANGYRLYMYFKVVPQMYRNQKMLVKKKDQTT